MPPLHTHRIQPGTHPTLHHTQPSRVRRHDPFTHLTAHRRHPTRQTIHTHCTSHAATNRTCTPMRPHPPHRAARHLGASHNHTPNQNAKNEKPKQKEKPTPNKPIRHQTPPVNPTSATHNQSNTTKENTTTKQQTAGNEEQEPCPITPSTNKTNTHREGMKRIKTKNTGICRGATHGLTVGCAPVGTKGAGQRPSRNKVVAHCTAPSTVSNASVRTSPCPSSACTVRRAPSTPDWPGGRMRSFHGLGAPLRVARII